jgi:arginine-tRNA-protein transferase
MLELPARELMRFRTPPRPCSYLPQETASLDYRVYVQMSEEEYQERLRRGWRRHGAHFFRPVCPHCRECRSLRVLVQEFRPSRSQRRMLRKNRDVQVVFCEPDVTDAHLRLFNAYHADMTRRRGWPPQQTTREDYENAFLIGVWPFAREMQYREGSRLIGVGLVDVVSDALSSIYFYHDPQWRPRAPGTFSILQELTFCRETGRRYLYLGYWIAGCPSMSYKANFVPHEVLENLVGEDDEPTWRRVPHPCQTRIS